MRPRAIVLSLTLLVCLPLLAREKTDILVMKNGDRLTGEIKGLDQGVLYVSFDYILGTSSVQWSKVAHLESKQLFIVKTQDGSVYTGTLSTAETEEKRPIKIEVTESKQKQTVIPRTQIVKMGETSDKFWERFNGAINSGIIYSKGNQNTQYSLGAEVDYLRERWSHRCQPEFHFVGQQRRQLSYPEPGEFRRHASAALEKLFLCRHRQFSTKLGAGHPAANQPRRRHWTLPEEYQPCQHRLDWRCSLAGYEL